VELKGKAVSVTPDGEEDGFKPALAYHGEMTPKGDTRLVASAPPRDIQRLHAALVLALKAPLNVLYRQKVNRRDPKPQGSPPRDFVALDLPSDQVVHALSDASSLLYHDARCELWIRGSLGEQVILDTDGMVFCYPDDPCFRDALDAAGIADETFEGMDKRDYVKHWFHQECDAHEDAFLANLGLQEVPHRRG
jgi:hypothetical protein